MPTNSRLCLLVLICLSLLHRYTHGGCVNSLPLFKSTRRPSSVPHETQQFLSDPTLLSQPYLLASVTSITVFLFYESKLSSEPPCYMWGGQMSVAKTLCYLKNLTSPSHLPQKSCGCFRFPLRLIEDSGAWKLCCETMSAIHPTLKQKLTLRQGSICWAKIKQLNRNRDLNLAKLKLPETTLVGYLGLPKRTVDGFQLKL